MPACLSPLFPLFPLLRVWPTIHGHQSLSKMKWSFVDINHSVTSVKARVFDGLGTHDERVPVVVTHEGLSLLPLIHVFGRRKPRTCYITIITESSQTYFMSYICGPNLPVNHEIEAITGTHWRGVVAVVRTQGCNVVNMRPHDKAPVVQALARFVEHLMLNSG
ncbi:hypothetical protein K439DRAFT_1613728 [Ramaria rubella]|nr:hypothetical protein K439DRAFT_1613728 [Ramaria rubella]